MSLYIDTSALVSTVAPEARTDSVIRRLQMYAGRLVISSWTLTEAHSALALKRRSGAITADQLRVARSKLAAVIAAYRVEPVLDEDFHRAAQLIVDVRSPLRAADALHLIICQRCNAELLSFDSEMRVAANEAGIAVLEFNP